MNMCTSVCLKIASSSPTTAGMSQIKCQMRTRRSQQTCSKSEPPKLDLCVSVCAHPCLAQVAKANRSLCV